MGQLHSDGKAIDVTAPAGTINFGDLYRIGDWNGIAMDSIASGDTARGMALEVSERLWLVKFPAALNPAVGAAVYWATPQGSFQVGETNLQAAVNGAPCAKIVVAKNAAGYAVVRVLNTGV